MNKKENMIFVVAWDYPPTPTGESIVCHKQIKYSKKKFIICRHREPGDITDYTYPANQEVISIGGRFKAWVLSVVKIFISNYKSISVINTRVMPAGGHIVGVIIKLLKPNVKWVVYFSDPLWNSPYMLDMIKGYSSKEFIRELRRNTLLQVHYLGSFFAKCAVIMGDRLVFSNEYLAKYVLGKSYYKYVKKVRIVPYGYDLEVIRETDYERKCDDSKFIISHIGQVYGPRNFNILADALVIIKNNYPELYERLVVRQVGNMASEHLEYLKNREVLGCFEFIDHVDYYTSLKYMLDSDYLLTIDAKFDNIDYNIYIPSKIYDYLGVRKPIVSISQSEGPTADIIRYTNNILIEHDIEQMADFIVRAMNKEIDSPIYDRYSKYDCTHSSELLDNVIEELLF